MRGGHSEDRFERREFDRPQQGEYDRYSGSNFDQRYSQDRSRAGEYDRHNDYDRRSSWDRPRGNEYGASDYDRRSSQDWDRSNSGNYDRYNGGDVEKRHAYNQDRYNRMDWDQQRMHRRDMEQGHDQRYNNSSRNEHENRYGGADFERGYATGRSHARDEHQAKYGHQDGMHGSNFKSDTNSSKQVRFDQRGSKSGPAGRDRDELTERTSQQYSFNPTSKETEKQAGTNETWSDKNTDPDNLTPGKKGKKSKFKKAS